jgi:hypothetical protein
MNASGESHKQVVPAKRSNKEEQSCAEGVEGSCLTRGNTNERHTYQAPDRKHVSQGLGGVREAARGGKKQKFTALLSNLMLDELDRE